jgi:hypothetical protein
MSHQRNMRGHSAHYPRGSGRGGASTDGRLARNLIEAVYVIRHEQLREKRAKAEAKRRAKIKPITLGKAPWE